MGCNNLINMIKFNKNKNSNKEKKDTKSSSIKIREAGFFVFLPFTKSFPSLSQSLSGHQ